MLTPQAYMSQDDSGGNFKVTHEDKPPKHSFDSGPIGGPGAECNMTGAEIRKYATIPLSFDTPAKEVVAIIMGILIVAATVFSLSGL